MFMESLKEFIVNNWQIISSVLATLISMVILLIKKSKIVTIPEGFTRLIIELVTTAEEVYGAGNGDKKLQYVYEASKKQFPSISYKAVKECVELVLSSPQKK